MTTHLIGHSGAVFVTDAAGAFGLSPGAPVTSMGVAEGGLSPLLVTDSDAFHVPTIAAAAAQSLLPLPVAGDDALYAVGLVAEFSGNATILFEGFVGGNGVGGTAPYTQTMSFSVSGASGAERLVAIGTFQPITEGEQWAVVKSCTVDGQIATQVGPYSSESRVGLDPQVSFWRAPGTASTDIDVVFNMVERFTPTNPIVPFQVYGAVWTLRDAGELLASTKSSLEDPVLNLNTAAGGVTAAAALGVSTSSAAWSGLNERFDDNSVTASVVWTGADAMTASASAPLGVLLDFGAFGGDPAQAGLAVSFSPAEGVAAGELRPSRVTDSDAIYAPAGASIYALVPALAASDDAIPAALLAPRSILTPGLLADDGVIPAPAIVEVRALAPALYAPNDDAAYSPAVTTGATVLSAPLVTSPEVFYSHFATLVAVGAGGPQQKLKGPPKHADPEVIYAARLSSTTSVVIDVDIIRVPVVATMVVAQPVLVTDSDAIRDTAIELSNSPRPGLVSDEDAIYGSSITMVLHPALLEDDGTIPAADVGWKLYVNELMTDADNVSYGANFSAYNELLPELLAEDDVIDTYPFFLQAVTGGIPVPPRTGVLTGSIRKPPQLTGSIAARRVA